jgi:hypothetical protein
VYNAVGMDECDTAAVKFDCAKNKEPGIISSMIMNSELNSTAVCLQNIIVYFISMISIYVPNVGGQSDAENFRHLHDYK